LKATLFQQQSTSAIITINVMNVTDVSLYI